MLTNLKIDQTGTFAGLVYLSCQPKTAFGSDVQETTNDGRKKWTVEVLGAVYQGFGGTANEVVKVGMASYEDPCKGLKAFTAVELGDFEIGVMEKTKKDKQTGKETVVGFNVWFRASEIKLAAPSDATAKAAA
jgi:hypothetical protein